MYNLSHLFLAFSAISEKDRQFLEKLGIQFKKQNAKEKVHAKLLATVEFLEENKRMPHVKEEYKGFHVYAFLNNIRYGHTSLTGEDRELLVEAFAKINK